MRTASPLLLIIAFAMAIFPAQSHSADAARVPPGATGPAASRCLSGAFQQRVEHGLAGFADVADIPGISVGVVASDALILTADAGQASRVRRTATSADTLYNIASVTKAFTATLALMLADEGIVALDAPIARYLPTTVRVPVDAAGGEVTIRHLLSHSAGLPRNPPKRISADPGAPVDAGVWDAYDASDLYAALAGTTLAGRVGEKIEYSNYGYALLGHVLERAAGEPYESLLRKRLLSPLGMRSTAITLTPDQSDRMAAFHWSKDPDRSEQKTRARYGDIAGHGGLTSSVRDLARFVAAQLRTRQAKDDAIPLSTRTLMAQPQLQAHLGPRFRTDMGLGWFRRTDLEDGSVTLFHVGEVDGHTAGLYLDPQAGVGVIVLQNLGGDGGSRGIEQIGPWLLRAASDELRVSRGCSAAAQQARVP